VIRRKGATYFELPLTGGVVGLFERSARLVGLLWPWLPNMLVEPVNYGASTNKTSFTASLRLVTSHLDCHETGLV
jgi:hypothetical protein